MTVSYQRDDQTGITRQINKGGYVPAEHLPGATMIPSNAGSFGGQQGVSLDDPMEMVINPGEVSEIRLSTSDVKSPLMKQVVAEYPGNALAAYAEYDRRRKAGEDVNDVGLPTTDAAVQAAAQQMTPENSNGIGKSPRKKRPVTPGLPAPHTFIPPTPPAPSADPMQLIKALQALVTQATPATKPSVALAVPAAPAQAPDAFNGMPVPKVRVTFKDARGGTWESSYHKVYMQGDKIILVYDLAFEFGSRINPPIDLEVPYELTIIPARAADGTPAQPITKWVLNMGIDHTFDHEKKQWSFQILHITEKPTKKVEEPTEVQRPDMNHMDGNMDMEIMQRMGMTV